jgi:hypothetical protein
MPPESATKTALRGYVEWTAGEYLAAAIVDAVRLANWQRTKDGHKGVNAPKPLPRPAPTPQRPPVDTEKRRRNRRILSRLMRPKE